MKKNSQKFTKKLKKNKKMFKKSKKHNFDDFYKGI